MLFSFSVVLIADYLNTLGKEDISKRKDLEKTDISTLNHLKQAFNNLNITYYVYQDPKELANNAAKHKNDIVLSIYGGEGSRNRMALVPSICETFQIPYIGPDTYGRIICQDKEVSKNIANDVGLLIPKHILLRSISDIVKLKYITIPYVIKPLLEGSSIGISQKNLITSQANDSFELISELMKTFNQPILVEEFIKGREVSFNFIEDKDKIFWTLSEVIVNGQNDYFDTHLFDAEEKLFRHLDRDVLTISDELHIDDEKALKLMIKAIGELGYGRIDGKLLNGRFYFIEITPDAWIAPTGAFAKSFLNIGWEYTDIIRHILFSTSRFLHSQLTSG